MSDRLRLAREQLARVQVAWLDPVDWLDLSIYGFLALENAVVAAAEHFGIPWQRDHRRKAELARLLHEQHGLTDISRVLAELNDLRKSSSYGEAPPSRLMSAEDIASIVERFIEEVSGLLGAGG